MNKTVVLRVPASFRAGGGRWCLTNFSNFRIELCCSLSARPHRELSPARQEIQAGEDLPDRDREGDVSCKILLDFRRSFQPFWQLIVLYFFPIKLASWDGNRKRYFRNNLSRMGFKRQNPFSVMQNIYFLMVTFKLAQALCIPKWFNIKCKH